MFFFRIIWYLRDRSIRPNSATFVLERMSDANEAVSEFLRNADTVYEEYDKGYMDADAALSRLEQQIETLREKVE